MAYVDARRGEPVTVLASAARTAATTSDTFHLVGGAEGLIVVIDATAESDTASVTFTLKGVDPVSGKTWDVLASAAVESVSTVVLRVSPHLTAVANLIAKDIVPAFFLVDVTVADADSLTYSVAALAV